ncbi:uncharacterized protein TNCV_3151451 [Trichonephila clavipes]|nr:uncharacterized protein TNCV_3151451 [Trichonephila clavipes]
MPKSSSQRIPDMLDWRQIWGSGRPRKGSNSAETVLGLRCRVSPSIVLLKIGSWEPLHDWQHMCQGRIESITTGSHTRTIVITAEIESGFVTKDNLAPFHCSPVSSGVHHSKQSCRWVGVKGSTPNGRRDPKCPSARRLRMVREDTGTIGVDTNCVWMSSDEAIGYTRAFLTIWGLLDNWSVEKVLSLVFVTKLRVNDNSRIHWSQHLLTTQSERPN